VANIPGQVFVVLVGSLRQTFVGKPRGALLRKIRVQVKLWEAISRRGESGILDLLLISAESDYTLTSAQVSESLEQTKSRSRSLDRDLRHHC